MDLLTPKRADSISEVVEPERFRSVQIWLKLPPNPTPKENEFYARMSRLGCSRAGGGSYPTLDMGMSESVYREILPDLRKNARFVKSVIFQEKAPQGSPFPSQIEAYLLQGAQEIKTDLF